jgi:hypothetical protein
LGQPVPVRPVLGTLRSGRVNAMAVAVPNSEEFIILFEDGLFGFANLLTKAVFKAIPVDEDSEEKMSFSTDVKEWLAQLDRDPNPVIRLFDALTAYLLQGHPHQAKPYLMDTPRMHLASTLRTSMEVFVLGHEYGHIVSGHLSRKNLKKSRVGVDQAEVIALNQMQEIEADQKGLELMMNVNLMKNFDLSLSFWGADFFFACIDIIEQSASLIRYGEKRETFVDTHPPTNFRREAVREMLRLSAPNDFAAPIKLADNLQFMLNRMFAEIEPLLVKLHKEGHRLAPGWD